MQNDYLGNSDVIDPIDKVSDPYKRKDYRYKQEEQKIDKMDKLRTEVEFLERGMKRVRTKL